MCWESTSTPTCGWLRLISYAARAPSSVKVGGILMSTTTRSGRCPATVATSSRASPRDAATSCPPSANSRASPSRSSTWSSAITTRMAAPRSGSCLCPARSRRAGCRRAPRPGRAARADRRRRFSTAPPTPSSVTRTTRWPLLRWALTTTAVAPECLIALVRPSQATKYAAASSPTLNRSVVVCDLDGQRRATGQLAQRRIQARVELRRR